MNDSLSIILSVHNVQNTLARQVSDLLEVLPELTSEFELLIVDKMADHPYLSQAHVTRLPDGLVVSLPSDTLFATGSATLTPAARDAALFLGGLLHGVRNRVDVNGHSDPTPISSDAFASNWELSTSRALAFANALAAAGLTRRIVAFGFADTRFFDISEHIPEESRLRLARRVDIVIRGGLGGDEPEGP